MAVREATARIKINKLLEVAGWRFFAEGKSPANIQLEPGVTIKTLDLDAFGENFEKSSKGFIDFLLLNEKGFPFIVLEAKAEDKNPLVGKEHRSGDQPYFSTRDFKAVPAKYRALIPNYIKDYVPPNQFAPEHPMPMACETPTSTY